MKFDYNLKIRLITAFVLVVLLLSVGFISSTYEKGSLVALALVLLVTLVNLCEFLAMLSRSDSYSKLKSFFYLLILTLSPLLIAYIYFESIYYEKDLLVSPLRLSFISILVVNILSFIALVFFGRNSVYLADSFSKEVFPALIAFLYAPISLLSFSLLDNTYSVFLWLLLVVALTDTAAYFVGRTFAGPKISTYMSPKKTLSGLVGGAVTGTIVGTFLFESLVFSSDYVCIIYIVLISIFVTLSSLSGDLLISYLKRMFNVKDSSNLLPGHGGMLDRTDAILTGSIALFASLVLLGVI